MAGPITLGIEEEVFVCEPEAPSTESLYHLARLLWSDPARHYTRTASNFARGADVRAGLMSCVEISTGVHDSAAGALEDLAARRGELGRAVGTDGLVVPLGHLLDRDTPTNVAALQVHVGAPDREVAYENLAWYLPVLALVCADSPAADGRRTGQSQRMLAGFATGPLRDDPTIRFQDLIVSKRLGTIEVRVPDPVWDLRRVRALVDAVAAIAALPRARAGGRERYNALRERIARKGLIDEVRPLADELAGLSGLDTGLLERTAADEVWAHHEEHGLVPTYSALDRGWREGVFEARPVPAHRASAWRSMLGWAGYYVPKFPYVTWKYLRER